MDKAERLMDLLAMLLDTRRPITAEEIRRAIPDYAEASEVAFRRMFERDKEELRDLGIPVELAPTDSWEVEAGYLIPKELATLPDLDLTADERAALSLAAHAWEGQAVPGSPDRALLKLSLASGGSRAGAEDAPPGWLRARIDVSAPVLGPLLEAIERRKRVTFAYRRGGGEQAVERTVEPHGLHYRGAWYLAGFDRLRGEVRHFKLERIEGRVEVAAGKAPDFEAPSTPGAPIVRGPWAPEGDVEAEATIAFSPDAAWWVERRTSAGRTSERADGWVEMTFPVGDRGMFVSWVLGFAHDAVVVAPTDLRDEVVARLRRAAGE